MVARTHHTNPTGIERIPSGAIEITLESSAQDRRIKVHFPDLKTWVVDESAAISIWAEAGNTSKKFDFGTVGQRCIPNDLSIVELDAEKPLRFRVAIWDSATKKILASNHRLKLQEIEDNASVEPLLRVRVTDLGSEVARLAVTDNVEPELLLNERIENIRIAIRTEPTLFGAIIPEAVRMALIHLAYNKDFDPDDPDEWQRKWGVWLATLGHDLDEIPNLDDADITFYDIMNWANSVVRDFAREKDFADRVSNVLGGSSDD